MVTCVQVADLFRTSIFSDGSPLFLLPQDPVINDEVIVRIRFAKAAQSYVEKVFFTMLVNGETMFYPMKPDTQAKPTEQESIFSYYTYSFIMRQPVTLYRFLIVTKDGIFFYNQRGLCDHVPVTTCDFKLIADIQMPEWVKDAVFYQIFPERFCNGNPNNDVKEGELDGLTDKPVSIKPWESIPSNKGQFDYFGGDLEGITAKIDYILDLGANALYINPIFNAITSHKYDCIDYLTVDEHFGGNEALEELMAACHKKGIHVMLDISINHTGHKHPWVSSNPSYYFLKADGSGFEGWCGIETLLTLNYTNKELCEKMYEGEESVLKKWLKPPYSIDAWRFDVGQSTGNMHDTVLDTELWKAVRKELKSVNSDVYLIGEHFGDAIKYLQGDMWDASMNYLGFTRPVRKLLGEKDISLEWQVPCQYLKNRNTRIFTTEIMDYYAQLPHQIRNNQYNLINSHDIRRFNVKSGLSRKAQLSAVLFLMSFPGAPSIYYGDEIDIGSYICSDSGYRYPMPWDEAKWCMETRDFYKNIIMFRKQSEALKNGSFKFISVAENVTCYARFTEEECVVLVHSQSKTLLNVDIPLSTIGLFQAAAEIASVGGGSWSLQDQIIKVEIDFDDTLLISLESEMK